MTDRERELSAMLDRYHTLGDYDHIRELLAAERDGRLVMLPCKVGDEIFYLTNGEVRSATLMAIKAHISDPKYTGKPTIIFEGYIQHGIYVSCLRIGSMLFLTREEAERQFNTEYKEGEDDEPRD